MAIAAVWDFPGRTPEQYEEVFRLGGEPIHNQPNRLSHECYRTEAGIRVIDVWRDEASFAAFGAVLGPRGCRRRPRRATGDLPRPGVHGRRRRP